MALCGRRALSFSGARVDSLLWLAYHIARAQHETSIRMKMGKKPGIILLVRFQDNLSSRGVGLGSVLCE